MSAIFFSNAIGPVPISVVVREGHRSSLGITQNPIESGANVTDHAYIEPKVLTLEFGDENAVETYNALVRFQESRVPFTIVSGLFVYNSMLILSVEADRDEKYSRVLRGTVTLQEAIIVETAYASSEEGGSNVGSRGPNQSQYPSKGRALDSVTRDRVSGILQRGDMGSSRTMLPTESLSVLTRMFGP